MYCMLYLITEINNRYNIGGRKPSEINVVIFNIQAFCNHRLQSIFPVMLLFIRFVRFILIYKSRVCFDFSNIFLLLAISFSGKFSLIILAIIPPQSKMVYYFSYIPFLCIFHRLTSLRHLSLKENVWLVLNILSITELMYDSFAS